jgi:multidrug efflux system outer membrane protein
LPSSILELRPDIRVAEQQLVAANADIGQARAAFYPQIALTGSFGYQSTELDKLFTSSAQTWQFVPSVNLPIFTGGRLQANADFAQAAFDEAVANYRKTVQNAFREVSDALIGYQRLRELRERQQAQTEAYRDATRLANLRYEGGVTSYFEVLYNEQEYFNAEIGLAQAARNEVIGIVQLYRALGGGAEPPISK